MSIDRETAQRVANLARIAVDETEVDSLSIELSRILAFMEELGEADLENAAPMTSVTPMELKQRVDEVTDGEIPERVLANAPDTRQGFYIVPKVIE